MSGILSRFSKSGSSGTRQALVGDTVVASAKQTVKVEGNDYFAPQDVNWDLLEPSTKTTVCPWKGTAIYYDVVVDGERYPAAAWTYADPSRAAAHIKDHIAFWRGVTVSRG